MPTTTITFTGAGSITLRATAPNTDAPTTIPGVVHRTQGGSLVSYQVGPQYWQVTLQCRSLTGAQKDALAAFFAANFTSSFTYTDENDNTFTARFLDTTLPFKKAYRESWEVDMRLNLSAMLK
ncbi:MAG TPA: hypothetical protein VF278_21230 [Pirellulales bacterium]